jgi:redox-sensing transcriptional repressor
MRYRRLPPALTINRLARYLNYLIHLPADQVNVSSARISRSLGIKASQFRQDFHYFGGFGRPGLGYNRLSLIDALEKILNVSDGQQMVIIGMGHLGTALANFEYFNLLNIKLIGLFDSNPKLIGLSVNGIPVRHPNSLAEFIAANKVSIGVITTPKESAQSICNQLVQAGVKGIWNFTPVQLEAPRGHVIRNEQPTLGLLTLTFQLAELEHSQDSKLVKSGMFSID